MPDIERFPMHAEIESENSRTTCGAKTRTGGCCKNNPITGKKRCRMHGGASLSGKYHWNYKHGYWSREEKQQRSQMMRLMKVFIRDVQVL